MKITDKQREAFKKIDRTTWVGDFRDAWAELRQLLPDELKPTPLPSTPGYYFGATNTMLMLASTGNWYLFGNLSSPAKLDVVATYMPLVPAVRPPEPVRFTQHELENVYASAQYGVGFEAVTDYVNKKAQDAA